MLRPEYRNKAYELIEWCSDHELKVLHLQAAKALNARIDGYLNKVERDDKKRKDRASKKIKANLTKTNKREKL